MSFPRYPEYKDSGVEWLGEVPGHWNVNQMKHRMRMRYGDALASEIREESKIDVFGSNGVVGTHSITNTKAPAIVVGRKGSYGKIVWAENGGFVIDTAYAIDIETTNEDLRWVYFALQPLGLDSLSQDTGVPGLAREKAYSIQIAVPPLVEQQSIATFLDRETAKIDALIAEQQRLIELLKEKRQAVISHTVTKGLNPDVPMKDSGIEWLGEVPAHWDRVQLGRVCLKVSDGPHFSPNYVDEGVMFLSARNINVNSWSLEDAKLISEADYVEFSKRVIPEMGDILYTKGGTTGIARVVDLKERFQVWVHVAVLKIARDIAFPHYIAYSLNSNGGYEQSQLHTRGATNQDLGLTRMIKIWLALPPIFEQLDIITFLDRETTKLDTLTTEAQRAIALLKERRSALISAAVTGKIDVRNHD